MHSTEFSTISLASRALSLSLSYLQQFLSHWPFPPRLHLQRYHLSLYKYHPYLSLQHPHFLRLPFFSAGVMGEAVEDAYDANGYDSHQARGGVDECKWYEEEIDDDLKFSYALNSVLHRGASKYQDIALLDTKHFGKALVIDGKMQSTEMDEFIYHECLIHPALLCHPK